MKKPTESQIAAAYVQDRSEQYNPNSCCRVALEYLAEALRDGEHLEAFKHGELDDLIVHFRKHRIAKRRTA